ncbi:uncharacterized protein [Eurosta solidaginis]|uniref:uncharacterized protein n=1 Tax=Eurosta solidaginis TaxID=178769 RepID=UPI0035308062
MISGGCAHKIEVDNLENGEIIRHKLLLIKGQIRHQTISTSVSATHATSKCTGQQTIALLVKSQSVEYKRKHSTGRLVQQQSQISRNGQFKLLTDLSQHVAESENQQLPLKLELKFCNIVQHLQIFYESVTLNQNSYQLQPLYIVCGDRKPSKEELHENCEKINLNLHLVQSIYAEQLRSAGFGRRTFALHKGCQVFETRQRCEQVWQQNEDNLWQNFAQELLNSCAWGEKPNLKFVAFIGCTKYDGEKVAASEDFSYANIRRHLKGHAALGGGGLALFGTGYFYAWPKNVSEISSCFSNIKPVDLTLFPDDSNYRRTHGGVYATTLGSVVHEIGHTFDLGHTKDGVMGNGFDYINQVFTTDNLTECLPDRIIQQQAPNANVAQPANRPRFTQLKRTSNNFLQKYHEQKSSEPFYFTRNCLIILAHHKWFTYLNCNNGGAEKAEDKLIIYDAISNCVISKAVESHPLCLIEVRSVDNSLVKCWYEMQSDKDKNAIYKFQLPREAIEAIQKNHYLFVLTQTGLITRLCEG